MYKYKNSKNIALIAILIFLILLLLFIYPLIIPIFLGLITGYIFLPFYKYFLKKIKNENISAIIVIFILSLVIIIPLLFISGLVINHIINTDINLEQINSLENNINSILNTNISITQTFEIFKNLFIENLQNFSQKLFSLTLNFIMGFFLFYFILFYFFTQNKVFWNLILKYSPFSENNSKYILNQSGNAVKALLIGQVLTAIVQGSLGMISFLIVGIDSAIFWGVIMIFFSLIPIIGAFIIWVPAGFLLIYQGEVGFGIFILIWGFLVISQIDNLIRPFLVNRFFKLHSLFIIIGILGGVSFFGMIGLILGPLFFAFFILLIQTYEKEFILK